MPLANCLTHNRAVDRIRNLLLPGASSHELCYSNSKTTLESTSMLRSVLLLSLIPIVASVPAIAQEKKTRDQMVREDREKVTTEGFWIYNDLAHAFEVAKKSGKPLLVVLRCIPCEECVKLDDELVDRDPVLRPLDRKSVV